MRPLDQPGKPLFRQKANGDQAGLFTDPGKRHVVDLAEGQIERHRDRDAKAHDDALRGDGVERGLFDSPGKEFDHADEHARKRREHGNRKQDAARRLTVIHPGDHRPAGEDQKIANDPADLEKMAGDEGRRGSSLPQDNFASRWHAGKTRQWFDFVFPDDELVHSSGS